MSKPVIFLYWFVLPINTIATSFLQLLWFVAKDSWEQGPAVPTLKFHVEKLWKICKNCTSRKKLILKNYIYLWDANDNKFDDPAIQQFMWNILQQTRELAQMCTLLVYCDQRRLQSQDQQQQQEQAQE